MRRNTGSLTHRPSLKGRSKSILGMKERQSEGGGKIASELSEADRMAKRRRKGCEC